MARNWGWGFGMKLSKFKAFAAAVLAALAAGAAARIMPANAADVGAIAPMPAAPYNWSGCYGGGFFGYAAANWWQTTDLNNYNPAGVNPWDFSLGNQAIGGGMLSCNWQAAPWVLFGIEGEGAYLRVASDGTTATQLPIVVTTPTTPGTVTDFSRVGTGYGAITARLGVIFLEKILVYGKIGVGFVRTSSQIEDGLNPGFLAVGSRNQTPLAAGFGVEYPISEHWTGRVEGLIFGDFSSYNSCGVSSGLGVPNGNFCWREDPGTIYTLKVGASYKFW
jgi:outer membrane immunogenic protein